MRFVNFKRTRDVRPSRLGAYLLRRCTQALATRGRHRSGGARSGGAVSVDQPGGSCFGPVEEADQLDLEAFVAGDGAGGGLSVERPDRDPMDPSD